MLGAREENGLIEASCHLCFITLSMGGLIEAFGYLAITNKSFSAWRSITNILVETSIETFFDLLLSHHFLVQLKEELDVD